MFHMHFDLFDLPLILMLAFIEILLSVDNALVLATIVRPFPPSLRTKALYIGILSAVLFRGAALFGISLFVTSIWLQAIGGFYLLYVAFRFFTKKQKSLEIHPILSFWKAVFWIEILDFIFAVDSILAGVALINKDPSKLWIVYLGGLIGIFGIRYAASWFVSLLNRFPSLETSAYLVVALTGCQLLLSAFSFSLPTPFFYLILFSLFILGFFLSKK